MNKNKGSITIFLSMILLVVVSIVFATTELGRIEVGHTMASRVTYMAEDSCFSQYVKEIYEDYGIMCLWMNEEELQKEYSSYVTKNTQYKNAFAIPASDLIQIKETESKVNNVCSALDMNAEPIYEQICDYMEPMMAKDVVNGLIDRTSQIMDSSGIDEFNEDMEKCNDSMSDMENDAKEIYEASKGFNGTDGLGKDSLNNMQSDIVALKTETDPNVREELFNDYMNNYRTFSEWKKKNRETLNNINEYSNQYESHLEVSKGYSAEMRWKLEDEKESYLPDVYNSLVQELDNIDEGLLSQEEDPYGVYNNQDVVLQKIEVIEDLDGKETQLTGNVYSMPNAGIGDVEDMDIFMQESESFINSSLEAMEGYEDLQVGITYSSEEIEKQENIAEKTVKEFKSKGVLNVLGISTSDKVIEVEELPSHIAGTSDGDDYAYLEGTEDAYKRILFGQYVLDYFPSYVDPMEEGNLNYQVEYILNGKDNDAENLKKTVNKIVAIREGFNFAYLLTDSIKMDEAYGLAILVSGYTGLPVVIRVTQFVILGAWAYAESLVDIKALLNGEKVPLMKQESDWVLALENIAEVNVPRDKNNDKGIGYEDYIRFLLYGKNKATSVLRVMDMIQLEIQRKYNDTFEFADSIIKCQITTTYEMDKLYSSLPFIVGGQDKITFDIKRKYEY